MQVSDYRVKVMIAEPKGKRGRRDPLFSEAFAHAIQQPGPEYSTSQLGPYSAMSEPSPQADREMQCSEEAINDVKGSASRAVTCASCSWGDGRHCVHIRSQGHCGAGCSKIHLQTVLPQSEELLDMLKNPEGTVC